ncbi:MAG: glycosyltransferase family 2 protein [Chitinophagaceae bacterium]|nr:glycosyltransferase family 2 protein [Chitinophagaceae bacterium]MBL0055254.1 glycosyltransferase family 2 protein [Chitinophagaceae bacterium]
MLLSVIIVNYNVKYFLEQCLLSVQKACVGMETEIIVTDNHSTDSSLDYLMPLFPSVKFISNPVNQGYAKANNQALAHASGEYILFLNPDTIISEDVLQEGIAFFRANPAAGALGVKMIDGSGKFLPESKRAFPSPMTSLYKLSGLSTFFPRSAIFARYYLGHLDENEDHEVDVLAGAFMMMPKRILDLTGSFDERFFMYGEDVDLSYRIQQAGYTNHYLAGNPIIHFKGESTKKGSLNYVRLFYQAMSLFVKKHYSSGRAGLFVFFIQTAIWFRAALSAIAGIVKRKQTGANLSQTSIRKKEPAINLLILASGKEKTFIETLIDHSGMNDRRLVENDDTCIEQQDLSTIVQALKKQIGEQQVGEIVWCENKISFKNIIALIQKLPTGIGYWFHASGSKSIVGSNSKDRSGNYIA